MSYGKDVKLNPNARSFQPRSVYQPPAKRDEPIEKINPSKSAPPSSAWKPPVPESSPAPSKPKDPNNAWGVIKKAPTPAKQEAPPKQEVPPLAKQEVFELPPKKQDDHTDSKAMVSSKAFHPENKGKLGKEMTVTVNYFRMNVNVPDIFQYDVKFDPEIESQSTRNVLLAAHKSKIGEFLLDGAVLFLQRNIGDQDVTTTLKNGRTYREIAKKREAVFQLYNIIFRKMMRSRGLQPIGRNYFDATRSTPYPDFNFEVWPGFQTACVLTDGGIHLNVGLCFKVLRTDNCLQFIQNFKGSKSRIREAVIGQIVLTRHNNKTYRVHDIDFDKNPSSTFERLNSSKVMEQISFQEFYETVHNLKITVMDQPLLAIRQKSKNPNEEETIIYLST